MGLFLLNEEKSSRIQFSEHCQPETETRKENKMVKRHFAKLALSKAAGPDDILRTVLRELAGVIT